MRIYFDTKFLEDGNTIDLISIGMVREDGEKLYLINRDCDWRRVYKDKWLMKNVVPHLLHPHENQTLAFSDMTYRGTLRDTGEAVGFYESKARITAAVKRFCLETYKDKLFAVSEIEALKHRPEFWAYYADYDWVVLCQLFGRMVTLPPEFPKFCRDFRQTLDGVEGFHLKKLTEADAHSAIEDAEWLKETHERFMQEKSDA